MPGYISLQTEDDVTFDFGPSPSWLLSVPRPSVVTNPVTDIHQRQMWLLAPISKYAVVCTLEWIGVSCHCFEQALRHLQVLDQPKHQSTTSWRILDVKICLFSCPKFSSQINALWQELFTGINGIEICGRKRLYQSKIRPSPNKKMEWYPPTHRRLFVYDWCVEWVSPPNKNYPPTGTQPTKDIRTWLTI